MSVLCIVVVGTDNIVQTVVNSASDCSALGINTFVAVSSQQSQPTLQDIFAMPLTSDLQTMWMLGFGLPIICYLTAWSMGILISMFKTRY